MKYLPLLMVFSTTAIATIAQDLKNDPVRNYIEKYRDIAIAEQVRTGVPAAITLAQGILESGAGRSELCLNAKNHFGIKCKLDWTGETYAYTDNAKDECFRKYEDDLQSYKDHSDFLKSRKHYASLFQLAPDDYKGWAEGLKKAGYATNPLYAKKLIALIEKYSLHQYSVSYHYFNIQDDGGKINAYATTNKYFGLAENNGSNIALYELASPEAQQPQGKPTLALQKVAASEYYVLTQKNGLPGFYAPKGDLLLQAAVSNKMRYAKLLEINDLADEPLPADMFIYLRRKNKIGVDLTHKMQINETLSMLSQEQGIAMSELLRLNHLLPGEEPEEGSVIYLQAMAPQKPDLSRKQFNTSRYNHLSEGRPVVSTNDNDYIPTKRDNNYSVTPNDPKLKALQAGEIQAPPTVTQPAVATDNLPKTKDFSYTVAPNDPKLKAQQAESEKKQQLAAQGEDVNIANETPVEEQIAKEKESLETVPAKEMSALDKLKAKLDKSVYGSQSPQQTTTTSNTPSSPINTSNTNPESSQEVLKRKIEANRRNLNNADNTTTRPAEARQETVATHNIPGVHVVKQGDTAFNIAKRYGISVEDLIKWNKLPANGNVAIGARLKIKP